mgnify:FL=1|tara:strand:+ start:1239 stop:1403 length:165 start_codon:yes stop_codon:yes gene_type:complete
MGNNKNVKKIFKKLTNEEKMAIDSYYDNVATRKGYKPKLPKVKKINLKKGGRAK